MKIGIIGGAGRMGQCISSLLAKDGFNVIISDKDEEKLRKIKGARAESNADLVKKSDLVLISLPLGSLEEAAAEISPFVGEGQIILDISSLKEPSLEIMHKHLDKAIVLGVHPMFGPAIKDFNSEKFVLTPTDEREEKIAEKIGDYLVKKGARVIVLSPKEHDDLMSVVLGLSHFVGLSVATSLSRTDLKRLKEVSGPTFEILLELVKSVVSQDPAFYASLQMNLPDLGRIENDFFEQVKKWRELIKNKDEENFVRHMKILNKEIGALL